MFSWKMPKPPRVRVLPEGDDIRLQFFCLACGAPYDGESHDLGRCRECQEPIRITTLSIMRDQFEAASPEVQHRILEVITLNRFWMTLAHVLTLTTRALLDRDEDFFGFFCLACGEVLTQASFDSWACEACRAPVTPATREALRWEFFRAPEAVKARIAQTIVRRQVEFFLKHVFWRRSRTAL